MKPKATSMTCEENCCVWRLAIDRKKLKLDGIIKGTQEMENIRRGANSKVSIFDGYIGEA